jgi:two-component system NtrC family sensor kinase
MFRDWQIFFSGNFIPHGHCYLWKPQLVWLHITSDAAIALSYALIPIALIYFIQNRKDVPFNYIFILFGGFIISCGLTHVMNIWTLWHPDYWLSGSIKFFCAVISVITAGAMIPLLPKLLAIPSPEQLAAANLALQHKIEEQRKAETALRKSESQLKIQALELTQTIQKLSKTQSQLIHSEKMSSLGQLVAGIAHEINNPVTFIAVNIIHLQEYSNSLIELLQLYQQEYPQPPEAIKQTIEEIELDYIIADFPKIFHSVKSGAARIQGIVKSLRTFSRLDESDLKEVDIHAGIESSLLILNSRLQNQLNSKLNSPPIKVIKDYGELPLVSCHPGELNQVFMNLLTNAIDAINESLASMKDSNSQVPDRPAKTGEIRIHTEVKDNSWVVIQISDNGKGIPTQILPKLFDPFFTTKPVGKGTGLGLSVSYQIIVDKHQGKMDVVSEPGQGAEFTIEIPLSQKICPVAYG